MSMIRNVCVAAFLAALCLAPASGQASDRERCEVTLHFAWLTGPYGPNIDFEEMGRNYFITPLTQDRKTWLVTFDAEPGEYVPVNTTGRGPNGRTCRAHLNIEATVDSSMEVPCN